MVETSGNLRERTVYVKERTTVAVSRELLDKLDKHKIHRNEPYEDVLKRLLKGVIK